MFSKHQKTRDAFAFASSSSSSTRYLARLARRDVCYRGGENFVIVPFHFSVSTTLPIRMLNMIDRALQMEHRLDGNVSVARVKSNRLTIHVAVDRRRRRIVIIGVVSGCGRCRCRIVLFTVICRRCSRFDQLNVTKASIEKDQYLAFFSLSNQDNNRRKCAE